MILECHTNIFLFLILGQLYRLYLQERFTKRNKNCKICPHIHTHTHTLHTHVSHSHIHFINTHTHTHKPITRILSHLTHTHIYAIFSTQTQTHTYHVTHISKFIMTHSHEFFTHTWYFHATYTADTQCTKHTTTS